MSNCRDPNSVRRHYIRLFSDPAVIQKAIFMLNNGYTYNSIALVLGCDHTSVMAFRQRMIKKGVEFKNFKRFQFKKVITTNVFDGKQFEKIIIDPVLIKKKEKRVLTYHKYDDSSEKISQGRDYKDYLEEYLRKSKPDRLIAEEKARVTIEKVRKNREKNGIVWEDNNFNF